MTVYLVQKLHWEWVRHLVYVHLDDEPLKAFVSREDAEEYRRVLERKHVVTPSMASYSFVSEDDEYGGYGGATYIGVPGQSARPNALYEVIEVVVGDVRQNLFLARLRTDYRLVCDYDSMCVISSGAQQRTAFTTRGDAERFCQNHSPIEVNPFRRNDYFLSTREDDGERIIFSNYSGARHNMNWQTFFGVLEAQQWSPPEEDWEPANWVSWWDVLCARWSAEERENNRVLLGLPNWGKNPFTHMDWCGDAIWPIWESTYYLDSTELVNFLDHCGISPPTSGTKWERDSEKQWVHWWDKTAPTMTDEQKTALWRLLDPQPWEIVEVELEDGR